MAGLWQLRGLPVGLALLLSQLAFPGIRSKMRTILVPCALIMLVFALLKTGASIRQDLKAAESHKASAVIVPPAGDLFGADASGNRRSFSTEGAGQFEHIVLVTIHSDRVLPDIHFWSRVMESIGTRPQGRTLALWGICDAGTACNAEQTRSGFPILAFLTSQQMHAVAVAESRKCGLLYDRREKLTAIVPIVADPAVQADLLMRRIATVQN